MSEKRFRTGKGIFEEGYPSETIIDTETGKTYYKGHAYSNSSKEICKLLNNFVDENEQLKKQLHYCKSFVVNNNGKDVQRIFFKSLEDL